VRGLVEHADIAERVVAAGADDQMRGVGGKAFELAPDVRRRRAVDRRERRPGAGRQPRPELAHDVRLAPPDIGAVVEDRVAEKDDVHELFLCRSIPNGRSTDSIRATLADADIAAAAPVG